MISKSFSFTIVLLGAVLAVGCSPSLAPMFKDFEFAVHGENDVPERVMTALEESGWVLSDSSALPTVVLTEERILDRRGIYKNTAVLEVLPVGDQYVRVLIHPYRDHLIGSRSKLPYLPGNIERQIVPDLVASFEANGLYRPGQVPSDSLAVE